MGNGIVKTFGDGTEIAFYLGDETWHDGPGWYYVYVDYPDEGSCGAFAIFDEAEAHAKNEVEA